MIAPHSVFAHAFGGMYTLPVPIWLFIYGGAAVLVCSFAVIGIFATEENAALKRNKKILQAHFFASKQMQLACKAIGLALYLLVIAAGIFGVNTPYDNIGPVLFWVYFFLAFVYISAIFGDVWNVANPLKTLTFFLKEEEPFVRYPAWLGYWPAWFFYYALISIELLSNGVGSYPRTISLMLLIYTLATIIGSYVFGRDSWFRYAEFSSVFFRIISSLSPFSRNTEKEITREAGISFLIFILFMLSSTAFDGLSETFAWVNIRVYLERGIPVLFIGYGALLLSPFLFLGAYLIAVATMRYITHSSRQISFYALQFAYSLVPIAFAYHFAHYFTLVLTTGQLIISTASDPFGLGWNLFGTKAFVVRTVPLQADVVWLIEVAVIVIGHIAGVYKAHRVALTIFRTRMGAFLSQIPMLILMVLYTVVGLWILAQPFSTGL